MANSVIRLLVMASLFWGASASAQTTLELGRNELLAEQAVAETLLKAIYMKAGMTANVEPMPPARASMEAESGRKDGEVARIYSYGAKHPELLRVEPAYYQLTTAAFAKTTSTTNLSVRSVNDLKNHSLGIIRGVQHSLDASAGLPDVQQANNAESLYGMLKAGRYRDCSRYRHQRPTHAPKA